MFLHMESAVMKRMVILILNKLVCPYSLAPGHMGALKLPFGQMAS